MKQSPFAHFSSALAAFALFAASPAIASNNNSLPSACEDATVAANCVEASKEPASNIPTSKAIAPVVQDYTPTPALWLLKDDDTHIYLFGTFHVLPEGLNWRTETLDRVISSADVLVVESTDEDIEGQVNSFIPQIFANMMQRSPVSQKLSPDAAEKWRKLIGMMGMPVELVDRMPPIFSFMMFGMTQLEELGSTGERGVETVLEAEFKESNRPILSIENADNVMRDLLALDEAPFISMLEKELIDWDGKSVASLWEKPDAQANNNAAPGQEHAAEPDPFADEHRWARGEDVRIPDEDFMVEEFGTAYRDVMLTNRNRAWAEWLDNRLETPGVVFVAVGAGHLWGPDSVQEMLTDRGLTAIRIDTSDRQP